MKTLLFSFLLVCSFYTESGAVTTPDNAEDAITLASFGSGNGSLKEYIAQHLNYPDEARANSIEGTVKLSFFVLPDGSLHRIMVLNGLGYGCDREVLELMESMPKWNPATKGGIAATSKVNMTIRFQLNQ